MGLALFHLGRHEEAAKRLEGVVEREPINTAAWALLAECYSAGGRTADAVRCLLRVTESDPQDAAAQKKLGDCLHRLGDSAAAIPHLEIALQLAPESDEVRYTLTEAHVALHHWVLARRVLGQALGDRAASLRKAIWKGRLRALLFRL
jgi:tetratricopeptide (TPR) repeat protein